MKILVVPPSDWLGHPTPSRLHFIFERLGKTDDVHVTLFENPCRKKIRESRLHIHRMRAIPIRDLAFYHALNSPTHFLEIQKLVKNEKIEIIVFAHVLAGTASIFAGRGCRIPVVCDYLDHFPESASIYYDNNFIRTTVKQIVESVTRWNLTHSDFVITVSSFFYELLKEYGVQHAAIIPNGVETDKFRPSEHTRAQALKDVGLEKLEDKLVLCYLGSVERWVNLDTVVEATKILAERGIPTVLLMVGGSIAGTYSTEVKAKGGHVLPVGFVDYSKVSSYIQACDICILPLRKMIKNLTIPLKLLEYFSCGKPVFSLPNSELEQRFDGALTVFHDSAELANLAIEWRKNPEKYIEKKNKGLYYSRMYSWDDIAKSYKTTLKKVLDEYGSENKQHSRKQ